MKHEYKVEVALSESENINYLYLKQCMIDDYIQFNIYVKSGSPFQNPQL